MNCVENVCNSCRIERDFDGAGYAFAPLRLVYALAE